MGLKPEYEIIVVGGALDFENFLFSERGKVIKDLPLHANLEDFLSIPEKVKQRPDENNDGAFLYPVESPEQFRKGWTYMRLSMIKSSQIQKMIFRILDIVEEEGQVFLICETQMLPPKFKKQYVVKINTDVLRNPASYKNPSVFFIFSGEYCHKVPKQESLSQAINPWKTSKATEAPLSV